jgi:hypothetical protein
LFCKVLKLCVCLRISHEISTVKRKELNDVFN